MASTLAMIRRGDKTDARMIGSVVNALCKIGRKQDARFALDELKRRYGVNPYTAVALGQFGQAFADRSVLEESVSQLEALLRAQPDNAELTKALERLQRALRGLTEPATSQAATTPARP